MKWGRPMDELQHNLPAPGAFPLAHAIRDGPTEAQIRGALESMLEATAAGFAEGILREMVQMQAEERRRVGERKPIDPAVWARLEGVRQGDLTRVLDAGLACGMSAEQLAEAVLRAFGGQRLASVDDLRKETS